MGGSPFTLHARLEAEAITSGRQEMSSSVPITGWTQTSGPYNAAVDMVDRNVAEGHGAK
ncbi:MAG: hypothetical protein JHC46_06125 [Solirubrobacteraceae bacterium]|nr:hypothetical protein [Solirubrobacteraceae bacterium]